MLALPMLLLLLASVGPGNNRSLISRDNQIPCEALDSWTMGGGRVETILSRTGRQQKMVPIHTGRGWNAGYCSGLRKPDGNTGPERMK